MEGSLLLCAREILRRLRGFSRLSGQSTLETAASSATEPLQRNYRRRRCDSKIAPVSNMPPSATIPNRSAYTIKTAPLKTLVAGQLSFHHYLSFFQSFNGTSQDATVPKGNGASKFYTFYNLLDSFSFRVDCANKGLALLRT